MTSGRNYSIKGRLLFLIVIMTALMSCGDNTPDYSRVDKFDPERDAAKDIELAVKEAQRTDKNIILDVGGEWCIWCHRLDEFIEGNEELKDAIEENYIVVKINYSPENKNEELLSKYPKIEGYPHLFVLNSDGEFLHSQNTGDFEVEKSYGADKILAFLEKWAPTK